VEPASHIYRWCAQIGAVNALPTSPASDGHDRPYLPRGAFGISPRGVVIWPLPTARLRWRRGSDRGRVEQVWRGVRFRSKGNRDPHLRSLVAKATWVAASYTRHGASYIRFRGKGISRWKYPTKRCGSLCVLDVFRVQSVLMNRGSEGLCKGIAILGAKAGVRPQPLSAYGGLVLLCGDGASRRG
jgi:hypothetical protein